MDFDFSSEFGQNVLKRLNSELCIWLTTVGPDGTPQPNPVWFLWEADSFLIYTQPDSVKVRNVRHNPKVALHFNSTFDGDNVVIFTGEAIIDKNAPLAQNNPAYLEKYGEGIADIEMTPESMGNSYHVAVRVKPHKVRGF